MPDDLQPVVIADDLTGAADTGVAFSQPERPVHLRFAGGEIGGPDGGAAFYTNTRAASPDAAGRAVRDLAGRIRRWPSRRMLVYKKIDSALRGNLGPEIDALLDGLGFRAALIAPAYPAQGRTTLDGVHRIHGVPVAETEMARDPVTPVTDSRIDRLLSGRSPALTGRIDLQTVEAGEDRLADAVRRRIAAGVRMIVFDATDDGHLSAIAGLAAPGWGLDGILFVGSAGLAHALAGGAGPPGVDFSRCRRILVVSGSASPVSGNQVAALREALPGTCRVEEFDPAELAGAAEPSETGDRPEREVPAVWILAVGPVSESAGRPVAPEAVVRGLARRAVDRMARYRPDALVLIGGDTAHAVFKGAHAGGMTLTGEILPGLAGGRIAGGPWHRLPTVTKAGAFGGRDTLVRLHRQLTGEIPS